jgi:hypothetical protein
MPMVALISSPPWLRSLYWNRILPSSYKIASIDRYGPDVWLPVEWSGE